MPFPCGEGENAPFEDRPAEDKVRRVGIFGWGIVAPRSPNVAAFAANLERAESWLSPFNGFGPDAFLVGRPEFSFADYRPWIVEHFNAHRFHQLEDKMDFPTL